MKTEKKGNRTLLLMVAISVIPVIASYMLYQWWRPTSHVNHGELMKTQPLAMADLTDATNGKPLPGPGLKGKWVLLTIQAPGCDQRCQQKLYYMRQVRTATNEDMERIERIWLLDGVGMPDKRLLGEHPGLWVVRTPDAAWTKALPAKVAIDNYIYLIDPLGNLVLRYDETFNPKGMLKDLGRLLKYSRIG